MSAAPKRKATKTIPYKDFSGTHSSSGTSINEPLAPIVINITYANNSIQGPPFIPNMEKPSIEEEDIEEIEVKDKTWNDGVWDYTPITPIIEEPKPTVEPQKYSQHELWILEQAYRRTYHGNFNITPTPPLPPSPPPDRKLPIGYVDFYGSPEYNRLFTHQPKKSMWTSIKDFLYRLFPSELR